MADALLIDICNYTDYPIGGELNFARHMLGAFGRRLALVGCTTDATPVGIWVQKRLDGAVYHFFSVKKVRSDDHRKPVVPYRLQNYILLRKYMRSIRLLGVRNVFVQCPECLMAVSSYAWDSICFRFPGVQNEMEYTRYRSAKILAGIYDRVMTRHVNHATVVLASASAEAIDAYIARTGGKVARNRIIQFPTRVDTKLFCPRSRVSSREQLSLPQGDRLILSCGRIAWSKGWELLLDAFASLVRKRGDVHLIYVGDGEDRNALEAKVKILHLAGKVTVTGAICQSSVAEHMNAANVFVVGSYREGWSNAMLEAAACGLPIVSTEVSGSRDIILDGHNGYVVRSRDPIAFAEAVERCLALSSPSPISLKIAQKYAVSNLPGTLGSIWTPLAVCSSQPDTGQLRSEGTPE